MKKMWSNLCSLFIVSLSLFFSACGLGPKMIEVNYVPPGSVQLDIWAESSLNRIRRDSQPKNSSSIELHAARNEWESFQIVLRSATDVQDVTIVPGDLTNGGSVIAGDLKNVYKAFQIHIDRPSPFNNNFSPGYYDDALVPLVNPETGKPLSGGRLRGYPFDLLKDMTQSFWIDIKIPSGAATGTYTGVYQVTAGGKVVGTIDVSLRVYGHTLPQVSNLHTNFNSPGEHLFSYYNRKGRFFNPAEREKIYKQTSELFREHRINAVPYGFVINPVKQGDGSYLISDSDYNKLKDFIATYKLNLVRVPLNSINPIPWLQDVVSNAESEREELKRWINSWSVVCARLRGEGYNVLFYTYIHDEAEDIQQFAELKHWGDAVKSIGADWIAAGGSPQDRVHALTAGELVYRGESYYSSIDIWCPSFNIYDPAEIAGFVNENPNNILWSYTALTHYAPVPQWATDFPLINYRIPTWVNTELGMSGLLYWTVVQWDRVKDPFTDPQTYNIGGYVYNGEGSLTYPALDAGFYGLLPSIRLKVIRDSIEDYDLLHAFGNSTRRQQILGAIAGSWTGWSATPEQLEAYRREMLGSL